MLEAVQLPAGVADLDTSLADVNGDTFAHVDVGLLKLESVTQKWLAQ